MSVTELAKRLCASEAVVFPREHQNGYTAYTKGDRRRRPLCWLDEAQFRQLRAEGLIEPRHVGREAGFAVSYSFMNRHKKKSHADQHRLYEDRDVYIPEGVTRSARINTMQTPLRRLAKRKLKCGRRSLSDAEIEAGERFAKDYAASHMGHVATQSFERAEGRSEVYSQAWEEGLAYRLDARRRVMEALACLGGGLDRTVMSVCVTETDLEKLERAENWSQGSGLTVLKLGLQKLVVFYGTVPGLKNGCRGL